MELFKFPLYLYSHFGDSILSAMHAAFASWKSEEVELNVKDWENYTGLKVVGIDSADVDS